MQGHQPGKDNRFAEVKSVDINAGIAVDMQTKQRFELSDRENTMKTIKQAERCISSTEMKEIIEHNLKEPEVALEAGREPELLEQPARSRPADSTRRMIAENFFVKDRAGKRF